MAAEFVAQRRWLVNQAVYNMSPLIATEFDRLVDYVGPLSQWPLRMAEAVVSTHLPYKLRFQLTLFLLGNRVPPAIITEWYLRREMLKDESARRHVAGILLAHKSGKLEKDCRTTYVVGLKGDQDVVDVQFGRRAHEDRNARIRVAPRTAFLLLGHLVHVPRASRGCYPRHWQAQCRELVVEGLLGLQVGDRLLAQWLDFGL